VTFKNSPFWDFASADCTDITVRKLTVHGDGPNTDGFDPDSCANILVENCTSTLATTASPSKAGATKMADASASRQERCGRAALHLRARHGTVVIGSEDPAA